MPPRRSSRTSITSPTSTSGDDISYLTLAEVRDRLNRNQALLNSPLFAISPHPPSPQLASSPNMGVGVAGPSSLTSPIRSTSDPIRDKLVSAREALLAREQELMMGNMHVKDEYPQSNAVGNGDQEMVVDQEGRRKSAGGVNTGGGGRSGKARVLNKIREDECNLAKNGLILPIDQTLHLGQRDYQNAAALSLSHLSLNPTRSSSPKPRQPRLNKPGTSSSSSKQHNDLFSNDDDEISRANRLARLNAFMSYKSTQSDDEDDDEDEDEEGYDDEDEINEDDQRYINKFKDDTDADPDEKNFPLSGPASGGYDGPAQPQPQDSDQRMIDEIGEEVDEFGEDDEIFPEGNDEYGNGTGQGSLAAGPGR